MSRLPDGTPILVTMMMAEASSAQKALASQSAILRLSDPAAARRIESACRSIDRAMRLAKRRTASGAAPE